MDNNFILSVARRAINILEAEGISCYLFGSAASALWGATRTANDVDIVVQDIDYTQEQVKRLLVAADRSFYTVPSTNPLNRYRVLWCRRRGRRGPTRHCKVDILIPPSLNLPILDAYEIEWREGLPVAPLGVQLLLKLQGWADHRASRRRDFQEKQYVDVDDIYDLLDISTEEGVTFDAVSDEDYRVGKNRVRAFIRAYPRSRNAWRALGLP